MLHFMYSPNNVRSLNGAQSRFFVHELPVTVQIDGTFLSCFQLVRDRNDRYVVQVKYTKTYITKESRGLHNLIP